jgi:hypothetical protein
MSLSLADSVEVELEEVAEVEEDDSHFQVIKGEVDDRLDIKGEEEEIHIQEGEEIHIIIILLTESSHPMIFASIMPEMATVALAIPAGIIGDLSLDRK